MAEFRRFSIGTSSNAYADTVVVNASTGILVYASCVGYDGVISGICKEANKVNAVNVEGGGYCRTRDKYDIIRKKQANSDFSHVVISKKDSVETNQNGEEILTAYLFYKTEEEKQDTIFDKLYKHTAVPILKEWMPYLIRQLEENKKIYTPNMFYDSNKEIPFYCRILTVNKTFLINTISNGLKTGAININGSNTVSESMLEINGLDSYLNTYAEILADKIQQSFVPKFTPGVDQYSQRLLDFDDNCYYNGGLNLYNAQMITMQSMINNLNKNKIGFVIGEMGCGKTALGCGITYAHAKRNGYNSMVLCPPHLVLKWKREIERLVPHSEAHVIKNLEELLTLDSIIRNKDKNKNLYIIMSKESAKFSYEMRPSAIWSKSKKTFVCPECGQPLTKKVFIGSGRNRRPVQLPLEKRDMCKQYSYNLVCENEVKKWNKKAGMYEDVKCNAKLWSPLNGADTNGWIKIGAEGWLQEQHVNDVFNELIAMETLTRKDSVYLEKLTDIKFKLEDGEKLSIRAPRKFSLAKYIKSYYQNSFDYLLLDEMHEYKGDTEQGQAAGELASVAKYTIGLTGTLLNGYADGLFYILYRTLPQLMNKEGFDFSDESGFMKTFGVVKTSNRYTMRNGRESNRIGTGKEKRLPGVSPLVFTKFLLENSVFISLSDMAEGLPNYEEIPIGVEMDTDLRIAYHTLEDNLRRNSGWRSNGGIKIMGALLQSLSVFPDMPYDQPPIIHPDTGETLVVPPELERGTRHKEERLLELVKRKIEAGEKVLIYYQWVNRTDIADRLTKMFIDNGINSAVLSSSVKAESREQWINDRAEDLDVLICNPDLVKTGLDLLDFTTICFYQVGYNIFTMRQASRRSWRLSQTRDIEVYFMYYEGTIQEQALSLMATKLQASMAIEGKFSEEGLRAMSNNEDLLTQIAQSVVQGIASTVDASAFKATSATSTGEREERERRSKEVFESYMYPEKQFYSYDPIPAIVLSWMLRQTEKKKRDTVTQRTLRKVVSGNHVANLF